ncbi:hypothetical protein AB3N59_02655 [Leptospira sp. WS92.C1]
METYLRKIYAAVIACLILYCAISFLQIPDFGKNASTSPIEATSSSAEPQENEEEKSGELVMEEYLSNNDSFVFGFYLEFVSYSDHCELNLIQRNSKVETPPPENLSFSI